VTFEHSVARGRADASYGVEVAATAGIDGAVVDRARELLDGERSEEDVPDARALDAPAERATDAPADERAVATDGVGETASPASERTREDVEAMRDLLADVDVATTTPLEALNTLATLKRRLDDPES
jgi:DNA mismatch repair protein MutS